MMISGVETGTIFEESRSVGRLDGKFALTVVVAPCIHVYRHMPPS